MEVVIKQTDLLYEQNKLKEAYELILPHKDIEDVNVQWRFARLCYIVGKMDGSPDPKQFATDAMKHIDKAVTLDPNCFDAQKLRGTIMGWFCGFEGYKKQIEMSFEIKDNFNAVNKLRPNDPTGRHLLGKWSYNVADVPWYMRSAAKYILPEVPTATYEEALDLFLEAEKLQEGFSSQNWLYIGKCYYNLSNWSEAKVWLKKAAEQTGENFDDTEARNKAEELLKQIE